MVLLAQSWSLIYQFGLHTERIGRLPRPIEVVFNTPSHHRVHHGANEEYLDRNYGGILIIWDRLFGTFDPEGERVRYGLTTNIETFNPIKRRVRRVRRAAARHARGRGLAPKREVALRGPGWYPVAIDWARRPRSRAPRARRERVAGRCPSAGSGTPETNQSEPLSATISP